MPANYNAEISSDRRPLAVIPEDVNAYHRDLLPLWFREESTLRNYPEFVIMV